MHDDLSLTPVQRRILTLLADGLPHSREELHACLYDDLGPVSNVGPHITALRELLAPLDQAILCTLPARGGWKVYYQHVVLLPRRKPAEHLA